MSGRWEKPKVLALCGLGFAIFLNFFGKKCWFLGKFAQKGQGFGMVVWVPIILSKKGLDGVLDTLGKWSEEPPNWQTIGQNIGTLWKTRQSSDRKTTSFAHVWHQEKGHTRT